MHGQRWITLALVVLAALGLLAFPSDEARAKSAVWLNYDVTLTVKADGSFHVVEKQEVRFSGGAFHYGYRDIATSRTEGVVNVVVSEITAAGKVSYVSVNPPDFARTPGTFTTRADAGYVHVEYGFDQPDPGTRTFVIEYDALGALRVYKTETPPNEQVYWNIIDSALTENGDVNRATATIVLPRSVDPASVVLGEDTVGPAAAHTRDGRTWRWTKLGLGQREHFVARMQFPPIVDVAAPAWQAPDDQLRAVQATVAALNTVSAVHGTQTASAGHGLTPTPQ